MNRLSFGVQDIDPAVQKAVHRVQTLESVRDLLQDARELGFRSTNVDLIYDLPKQSVQTPAHRARDRATAPRCARATYRSRAASRSRATTCCAVPSSWR